jgi:hypothetical protein
LGLSVGGGGGGVSQTLKYYFKVGGLGSGVWSGFELGGGGGLGGWGGLGFLGWGFEAYRHRVWVGISWGAC